MENTIKKLFLEKLEAKDANGCIKYKSKNNAYPAFTIRASRLAYLIYKGEIPDKMVIMHTCDNPSCVNPQHLIIGTHQQNSQDYYNKRSKKIKDNITNNPEADLKDILNKPYTDK